MPSTFPQFVFFGSSSFSVVILETLLKKGFRPSHVVTMPDRPKGRNLVLTPTEVKVWAMNAHIRVLTPEQFDTSFEKELRAISPELFVVASFGAIIPKNILSIPQKGALNVHPSLLPRFRGATPIQSAILEGVEKTGVSIILMDEKMDHGPLLAWREYKEIITDKEYPALEKALALLGAEILVEVIPDWLLGNITPKTQDESLVTFTKKIEKTDGLLDLSDPPEINWRKIRAYKGTIGTYFIEPKTKLRVKITKASYDGKNLVIENVIPESKKEMRYEDFLKSLTSA